MAETVNVYRAIASAKADIAAADSAIFDVSNAEAVSLIFKAAAISSGNGVFSVDVGVKAPGESSITWLTGYAKLITNAANTNAQTPVRVASITLSGNGLSMVTLDPVDAIQFIRVPLNMTTDGTYDCWIIARE